MLGTPPPRDAKHAFTLFGPIQAGLTPGKVYVYHESRGRRWDPAEGIGILQNCVKILKMSIGKYGCVIFLILLNKLPKQLW